jgi:hypothetical protein
MPDRYEQEVWNVVSIIIQSEPLKTESPFDPKLCKQREQETTEQQQWIMHKLTATV